MKKTKLTYLDSAANTPMSKTVFRAMKPFLEFPHKGNSFAIHKEGIENFQAIDKARKTIAKKLCINEEEIYFTSGATESNNWIIISLALHELEKPIEDRRLKIILSAGEHSSVSKPCKYLEKLGFIIKVAPLKKDGTVKISEIKKYLDNKTLLVCVMSVNNETGSKNNVDYIAKLCHRYKALILSDCTQRMSADNLQLGYEMPNVDYLTFSAHKFYGPTGVGCLIVRAGSPLYPYIHGGNQESGFRGGTHNTAGIVGMAKAIEIKIVILIIISCYISFSL